MQSIRSSVIILAAIALQSLACAQSADEQAGAPAMESQTASAANDLPADVARRIEAIRGATSAYASFDAAMADGWSEKITDCMESDAGGQGFHYGRVDLINDGAALDPLMPELLMYEPQADASMQLVGVEYIIPVADWKQPEPPMILGRKMHVNEKFGVWVQHLWYRDNPSGIFSDFNPTVSCANAPAQTD